MEEMRPVNKIVQDYQDQLADVRLEMVELRSQLANLKPMYEIIKRVGELPAKWRSRAYPLKRTGNECAAELEKILNG